MRRIRADLILVFSILRGFTSLDPDKLFELRAGDRTRGHPYKLVIGSFKLNPRKYFFSNRVVGVWNDLPAAVVGVATVGLFKKELRGVDLSPYCMGRFV